MARKAKPTLVYLKNDVREFPDAVRAMEFVKKLNPDRALVWDVSWVSAVEYLVKGTVVAQMKGPVKLRTDEVASHMPPGSLTKEWYPYYRKKLEFKSITEYRTFYVEYSVPKGRDLVEYKEVRYRAFSALNLFDLCLRCKNFATIKRIKQRITPRPDYMLLYRLSDCERGTLEGVEAACQQAWNVYLVK